MKKIICYSLMFLFVITLCLFINIKTSEKIEVNAQTGYTISFETNGGQPISSLTNVTNYPDPLPTPIREGFIFKQWQAVPRRSGYTFEIPTPGATITSSRTLYAIWQTAPISNLVEAIPGTILPEGIIKFVWSNDDLIKGLGYPDSYDLLITNNGQKKVIYTEFHGSWYGAIFCINEETMGFCRESGSFYYFDYRVIETTDNKYWYEIDTTGWSVADRTVSSGSFYYEVLGYSITFEENGGTEQTDLTGQTALPNPLPIPTKSGYTFLGWYYDSSFTNAAIADDSLTSDVTLYAKWQLNTYTITYNSNGGSSVPSISDVTQLPSELPIPTGTGYYFQGWFYDSDFTNEALAGDPLTSDVTLYAMWTQYNRIFFNTNGGNTIPSIITTDIIPDNLPIPVRNDDIFIGWYYDESLSDPVESNDILSSNITLYASWIDYDGIIEYFNDIYKDGYDDGYDDTFDDSYNQGYDLGFEYGYPYGYDEGYRDGLMEDHPIEFQEYFDKGYFDARDKYGKQIDDYQWESAQIAYENGQKSMGRYANILMFGIVIITIIGGVLLYYSLKRRNE